MNTYFISKSTFTRHGRFNVPLFLVLGTMLASSQTMAFYTGVSQEQFGAPFGSAMVPILVNQQNGAQSNGFPSMNAYKSSQDLWQASSAQHNLYVNDENGYRQAAEAVQPLLYQWAAARNSAPSSQEASSESSSSDVCQTGFVEHCLVKANSDGEQRLVESMALNQTGAAEHKILTSEFDGMCHVVLRFIDCLNEHYVKCSPVSNQNEAPPKDMFYESWSQLCTADGAIRKSRNLSLIC